jgi:hypothetical protein
MRCIVLTTMRYLLFLAFAASFAGADCGTPSGLTRTCPGSQPQKAYFGVAGSCGAAGVMEVTVANAGDCDIAVIEPTGIGLPSVGGFNDMGSTTNYELSKGNWNLNDPSVGDMNVGTFLSCTGGAANAAGDFDMNCEQRVCTVGDSDDVQCSTGVSCTAHLSPASAPASADAGK